MNGASAVNTLGSQAATPATALLSKANLVIRRKNEGDNERFQAWQSPEISTDVLQWIEASPLPKLFFVAVHGEHLVGYNLHLGYQLHFGNRQTLAFRGDLRISEQSVARQHPQAFRRLADALHQAIATHKALHFGFPIPRLVPYYIRRCQARIIKSVPRYVAIIDPAALARYKFPNISGFSLTLFRSCLWLFCPRRHRTSNTFRFRQITAFDERVDGLWRQVAQDQRPIIFRNASLLNWRFFQKPKTTCAGFVAERNESLSGYIVVDIFEKNSLRLGRILDLLGCEDPEIMRGLLAEALEYFRCNQVALCECYVSDRRYETLLRSFRFFRQKDRACTSTLLVRPSGIADLDSLFQKHAQDWFMTKFDLSL